MNAKKFLEDAAQLTETVVSNRRYLHEHPETGFDLNDTYDFVRKSLVEMGYEPMKCGKSGIVALAGGKKSGKVFLIRADMDALPIKEESDVVFPSVNGCMHACGHDMHTAMLLGAAKLLKDHESQIEGTVKLMFQPAEEIFEGSEDMIKAGLLQNPAVDGAMMIHVMTGMPFNPGTIIVSAPGISAPAADYFEIKVHGLGCHGSMPNTGVDPLNAAAHILIALQEINSRELSIDSRSVLTFGKMIAGSASNAIPDSAVMGGTLRTFDEDTRSFIKERIEQISDGIAKSFRAKAEVVFGSKCPTLENDKELSICVEKYAKELFGRSGAFSVSDLIKMSGGQNKSNSIGSEDFAYISQKVPSVMLALAAGQPEKGYVYPQHHPMVKFDEDALVNGSAIYAYAAMRWLDEHKL